MAWPDRLEQTLPPPRDDEPEALRRAIADELEDHLACALAREQRQTDDEQQARKKVLERFGDPQKIARQLWWDAMKEKIMKDRMMLLANFCLTLVCLAALAFTWSMFQESRQFNQAMLEKLQALTTQPAQPAIAADQASVKIKLVDGDLNGKALPGVKVQLRGQPFNAGKDEGLEATTVEDGTVSWGPIRAGNYELVIPQQGLGTYFMHWTKVVLFGGKTSEETIVCPAGQFTGQGTAMTESKINLQWPAEVPRDNLAVGLFLQRSPTQLQVNAINWWSDRTLKVLVLPDGRLINDVKMDGYNQVKRVSSDELDELITGILLDRTGNQAQDTLQLGQGQYELTGAALFNYQPKLTEALDGYKNLSLAHIIYPTGQRPSFTLQGNQSAITMELPQPLLDAARQYQQPEQVFNVKWDSINSIQFHDLLLIPNSQGETVSLTRERLVPTVNMTLHSPEYPQGKELALYENEEKTLGHYQVLVERITDEKTRLRLRYLELAAPLPSNVSAQDQLTSNTVTDNNQLFIIKQGEQKSFGDLTIEGSQIVDNSPTILIINFQGKRLQKQFGIDPENRTCIIGDYYLEFMGADTIFYPPKANIKIRRLLFRKDQDAATSATATTAQAAGGATP